VKPSTKEWIERTISRRLQRIAEGKESFREERTDALLSILQAVSGDVPSLAALSPEAKEWLRRAIGQRLDAIASSGDVAQESRIELLTEAYAALTRAEGTGGGTPGPQGPPGRDGQIRFTGQGPPGTIVGAVPGDNYLDILTGDVYRLV